VQQTAQAMGLPLRTMTNIPEKAHQNGFASVGPARKVMGDLSRYLSADWSIQNGEIQLVAKTQSNGREAVLLTPETGLIDRPEPLDSNDGKLDGAKPPSGWRLKSLLQPGIEPGGVVMVESQELKRQPLKVKSVQHTGDSHGGNWYTEIETVGL